MSEFITVARPYAKAAFDFAVEHQSVERQFYRRHTQRRLVDNDYIHGVCQRRNHHERHT